MALTHEALRFKIDNAKIQKFFEINKFFHIFFSIYL